MAKSIVQPSTFDSCRYTSCQPPKQARCSMRCMSCFLFRYRNDDVAVRVPLDMQRLPGIAEVFVADVLAGAMVDLGVGVLVDGDGDKQAAAGLEPATRHP